MTHSRPWVWVLAAALSVVLGGCGGSTGLPLDDPNGTGSGVNRPVDGTNDNQSVGDVTTDGQGGTGEPDEPLIPQGSVSASIRNESSLRADITLRFISEDTVVHLAFVRVLPDTVTAVRSPRPADRIELSGVDEEGGGLASRTFDFGDDYDEDTPAEYIIPADTPEEPPDNPPPPSEPAVLTMLEPSADVTVTLGSAILVRWADEGGSAGSVVRLFLQPAAETGSANLVPLGPAVGAALDGINDEVLVVVQGVEPGRYEVVGEVDDGTGAGSSVAPGRVSVLVDPGNAAPSLSIRTPTRLTELRDGELLRVKWNDEDEDDNATIAFTLNAAKPTSISVGPFAISPPLAEDPDGAGKDEAALPIEGVLPGLYDLVGTIDDGRLRGTDRVAGAVRVLAELDNDTPALTLIEPSKDARVNPDGSFRIQWADSDKNDNARISLMLDPDLTLGSLDGDEIVLVASLGEDGDGAADEITLGIPAGVPKGVYRVAGAITDGSAEVVTWAPGIIYFDVPLPGTGTPPQLALVKPASPLKTRLGDTITVHVFTADVPPGALLRLYLSNRTYGGTVRADVTPASIAQNQDMTLTLPTSTGLIPNISWPRSFNLEAELTVEGTTYWSIAPGTVWIRQEVEVVDVERVRDSCDAGLRIKWYGGGFQEEEPHADVQFWVSSDGSVPDSGEPDRRHMVIGSNPESPCPSAPDTVPVLDVDVRQAPGHLGGDLDFTLAVGEYVLVTVVEPEGFGRIVSPPHPEVVNLCYRVREPEQP